MVFYSPEFLRETAIRICQHCGIHDWRFTRTDDDGCAYIKDGYIETADPTTLIRLHTVAHECGHLALDHGRRKIPDHRREYESEQFSILVLRRFSIQPDTDVIADGQEYIATHIDADITQRGVTTIDLYTLRWSEAYLSEATRHAIHTGRVRVLPFPEEHDFQQLLTNFLEVVSEELP